MWAVLVVLAIVAVVPNGRAPERYERPRVGLSVVVPGGWTVVREPLSPCTNPVQRMALRGNGAVVQIVERLSDDLRGFPHRPRRFELAGAPEWLACCPPAEGKGWFLTFGDGGRGFHAYVYLGRRGTRADVLRILDSLSVRPRPA